jgi:hypothetical protein
MHDHTCSDDACTCSDGGELELPPRTVTANGKASTRDVWLEAYTKPLVSRETTDPRY